MYKSIMKTIQELGETVAASRKALGLRQKDVAAQAGISPEALLRFERGQVSEFGSRKLLAVLAVLGMRGKANEALGLRSRARGRCT